MVENYGRLVYFQHHHLDGIRRSFRKFLNDVNEWNDEDTFTTIIITITTIFIRQRTMLMEIMY